MNRYTDVSMLLRLLGKWGPIACVYAAVLSVTPSLVWAAAGSQAVAPSSAVPPSPPAPAAEHEPPPAPPKTDPSVEDQVDAHVQKASEHFSAGHYRDSAAELRAAHDLDPQPIFLFNIAQSLRRGQQLKEALSYYQRYLVADPKTSLRAETNGYIQELTALLEKQEQLEREKRKPAWRKAWFWGLMGGGVALVATGLGLGLGLGLRDTRTVITLQP